MANQLISSPPHFSNIHISNAQQYLDKSKKNLVLITTPFALPFSNSLKNSFNREKWFTYRYDFMRKHLFKNILSQSIHSCDHSLYFWLVFVAEGDRQKFNLPKYRVLANGIIIMWVEISILAGNPPNNIYLNHCLPQEIRRIVTVLSNKFPYLEYVTTLRIDSDDCISSSYLNVCNFSLSSSVILKNPNQHIFYFPNGLNYDIKARKFVPYIWPESPFMFRKEKLNSHKIKTVWEYPHDQVASFRSLYPVISTQAMWCLNIGHGNMANRYSEYHVPVNLSSSASLWNN